MSLSGLLEKEGIVEMKRLTLHWIRNKKIQGESMDGRTVYEEDKIYLMNLNRIISVLGFMFVITQGKFRA
jgi:hypothetical protein